MALLKKTTEMFIEDARKVHGDRYEYGEYLGSSRLMTITCKQHGTFQQTANSHLSGRGCPFCAGKHVTAASFVEKAKARHSDNYGYDLVCYKGSKKKVAINCKRHGIFYQAPSDHLAGKGCGQCGHERRGVNSRTDFFDFVAKAQALHGSKYDYIESSYSTALKAMKIICPHHGVFSQRPNSHVVAKQGCPQCGGTQRLAFEDFAEQASLKFQNRYKYIKESYTKLTAKVTIVCPDHGEYSQMAINHLRHDANCPRCSKHISRGEKDYLDSVGLPDDKDHRQVYLPIDGIRTGFRVDGFDPATNTVYEFHGDYWHGNPTCYAADSVNPTTGKTFGSHYRDTVDKQRLLERAGFRVIVMWESEWKKMLPSSS